MATPAVVGAAALLLQEQSTLTPDQVKARLMHIGDQDERHLGSFPHRRGCHTCRRTSPSTYDLFSVRSGLLNVQAATTSTELAPATVGSALSPTAVYNPQTGTVSLVYGNSTRGAKLGGLGIVGGLGHLGRVGIFGREWHLPWSGAVRCPGTTTR